MAASWSEDSEEKTNSTRLSRLLIDGGTQALRGEFDKIHPPSTLAASLHAQQPVLNALRFPFGGRPRVLYPMQWNTLYPSPAITTPTSLNFDITLLFILLRTICGLTAPATGWDKLPSSSDDSLEANLARVKYYRNEVYGHISSTATDGARFEYYWRDISCALVSLGIDQVDIDSLKSSPIGETDYVQLLEEWCSSDAEIVKEVREVQRKLDDIESKVDQNTLVLKNMEVAMDKIARYKEEQSICLLAESDFTLHIDSLCKRFNWKTRTWLLKELFTFTDSDTGPRLLLLTAPQGMGKSTIAAVLCKALKEQDRLGGCHFFQYNNATRNDARLMLQSIACQLGETIPLYKRALAERLKHPVKEISKMNCESLFTVLFEEPFCSIERVDLSVEKNVVIVIDALDECSQESNEEFIRVLVKKSHLLPKWLRFCFTAIPSQKISAICNPSVFKTIDVDVKDPQNVKDICIYSEEELNLLYCNDVHDVCEKKKDEIRKVAEELSATSGGLFVYAHFVIEDIKNRKLSLLEAKSSFLSGLTSVYERYFRRLIDGLGLIKERFLQVLRAVVAMLDPLPRDLFHSMFGLDKDTLETNESLKLLFPVENSHVTVFHKSVFDWLTQEGVEEHDFSVRISDGHEVLARHCIEILDTLTSHIDYRAPLKVNGIERYALQFGLLHMHECTHKDKAMELMCDIKIVTSALCIDAIGNQRFVKYKHISHFNNAFYCLLSRSPHRQVCSDSISAGCYMKNVSAGRYMKNARKELQHNTLLHREKEALYLLPEDKKELNLQYWSDSTWSRVLKELFHCQKSVLISFDLAKSKTCLTVNKLTAQVTSARVYDCHWKSLCQKSLSADVSVVRISPDGKCIILDANGTLEVRDSTELEVMPAIPPTLPRVISCQVFGGEQWKIAVKCVEGTVTTTLKERIWIVDGTAGMTESIIECCDKRVAVLGGSRDGHILINVYPKFHLYYYPDHTTKYEIDLHLEPSSCGCYKGYDELPVGRSSASVSTDGNTLTLWYNDRSLKLSNSSNGTFQTSLRVMVGTAICHGSFFIFTSNTRVIIFGEMPSYLMYGTMKLHVIPSR